MLRIEEITNTYSPSCANECDPDYYVLCLPDHGACSPMGCTPDANMCAPDYGEDGCLPDCSPEQD